MFDNLGIYNSNVDSDYDINKHIEQGAQFKNYGLKKHQANEHIFLQESSAPEWGSIVDAYNGDDSIKKGGLIEGMTMTEEQIHFNNLVSEYATANKMYVSTYLNAQPHTPNVRYIRITPNANGDFIQISKFVVNAFVDGALVNVAPRGTCTAANVYGGTDPNNPIKVNGGNYYSASASRNNWWQLDLGQDYNVAQVIYYNREGGLQKRALGMQIQLKANNGTVHPPITLTTELKQVFNVYTNERREAAEAALLIQKNNILTAADRINNNIVNSKLSQFNLINASNDTHHKLRKGLNELNRRKALGKSLEKYDIDTVDGAIETSELKMNSMYYHVFVYLIIAVTLLAFVFNMMVNPDANVLTTIYVLGALFTVYIVSKHFVD